MARISPDTWPIRWRIAVLNMSIVAVTLLGLGAIFLAVLDNALVNISAEYLRDQARSTLNIVQDGDRGRRAGAANPPPPPTIQRSAEFIVRRLSGPDTSVAVYDTSGALVAVSETQEDMEAWPPPPRDMLNTAASGAEGTLVVSQQSRRTLLLLMPLRGADREVIGVITVAGSLELVEQLQHTLRTALRPRHPTSCAASRCSGPPRDAPGVATAR